MKEGKSNTFKSIIEIAAVFIAVAAIITIISDKATGVAMGSIASFFATFAKLSQRRENIPYLIAFVVLLIFFSVSFISSPLSPVTEAVHITKTEITSVTSTEATTEFETTSFPDPSGSNNSSDIVYIGKSGSKYHKQNCSTLKNSGTPIALEAAISQGKTACKKCKP